MEFNSEFKGLILCSFKRVLTKPYNYGCIKSKDKEMVNNVRDSVTVSYVKVLSLGLSKFLCYD